MALRHEAARQARYGRPTAILLVDLRGLDGGPEAGPTDAAVVAPAEPANAPDSAPAPTSIRRLIDVIGQEARETDRAMRTPTRILVMLPETTEDEAAHLAARIERGYRTTAGGGVMPTEIRIEIAAPRRGADPQDAIDEADRRIEDALEAS
jgi:hypothetical protein